MPRMQRTKTEIQLSDGTASLDVFHPDGEGPWPGVLFYMDGIGMRDELREMAARFASYGYFVVAPDMYYRSQPYAPFDAATVFGDQAERARLMPIIMSITSERGMKDTEMVLDWLAAQDQVKKGPFGCVGYCLGGRLALTAAGTFPDRIAAAAPIHGGRLVTADPDSPHLGVPKIRAKMYIAACEVDPSFTTEDRLELEKAMQSAHVSYKMDVIPAGHGFAVPGTPVYDRAQSERHFEQVAALFAETLGGSAPTTSATNTMPLGNFSVSLAVKDLAASRAFYEKLGFTLVGGDAKKNWVVLKNGTTKIGLFQGMFEKNMLTFNPGWDHERNKLAEFTDVRELQKRLKSAGIEPSPAADESGSGPGYFMLTDPDGNPILVDQHV